MADPLLPLVFVTRLLIDVAGLWVSMIPTDPHSQMPIYLGAPQQVDDC